jgi:hypothetical protein
VGNIEVPDRMEKAAKSVTFWVPQRSIQLHSGSDDCTWWSAKGKLAEPGVMVSVPKPRLKLLKRT